MIQIKRNKYDIIADLLRLATKPICKTRMMYGANMSYNQFKEYLVVLVKRGLIVVVSNPHELYQTTGKGLNWLEIYKQLDE